MIMHIQNTETLCQFMGAVETLIEQNTKAQIEGEEQDKESIANALSWLCDGLRDFDWELFVIEQGKQYLYMYLRDIQLIDESLRLIGKTKQADAWIKSHVTTYETTTPYRTTYGGNTDTDITDTDNQTEQGR
jgi:hypothetical protein